MQSCSQIVTVNKPTSSVLQTGCLSCRPTNSVKNINGVSCVDFVNCHSDKSDRWMRVFISVSVLHCQQYSVCVGVECSLYIVIWRQETCCWLMITSWKSAISDSRKTSPSTPSTTRNPTYDQSFDCVCVDSTINDTQERPRLTPANLGSGRVSAL